MSEPLTPSQDPEIATMAAELAKRRQRLVFLNVAILILPLAAGAVFLLFGRSDRAWVQETVAESVTASVPAKVEATIAETVPARVEATVQKIVPAKVDAALARGVAPVVQRALEQRLAALEAAESQSPERFVRKRELDALQEQINAQKLDIERQKGRLDELEPVRSHLAQAIRRLKEAETTLQGVLDRPLPNIPGIDDRIGQRVKESLLSDIVKARQELAALREELQAAQD